MTIVFSAVSPDLIVMTVDSAVALDFKDHREYETGQKSYFFRGVGCVTTWGARDHNRIGDFLDRQEVPPNSYTVHDLADLVLQYLKEEYRPHELNLVDVGYHIAGFDRENCACLYHVFWGFDRPKPPEQVCQDYKMYNHTPPPGEIGFLYNGRNDLAHVVVSTLLDQIRAGNVTRFDLTTPVRFACFGDFVTRFAAELTPEVGPPFITYLISPRNEAVWIKNDTFCPISGDKVLQELKNLGYEVETNSNLTGPNFR